MRIAHRPRRSLASAALSFLTAAALVIPVGAASAAPVPEDTAAPASAEAAQAAALVWSDEFNGAAGSAPNPANWNHETGAHGWGNNELQNYTSSRANSALDGNGNLVITARREAGGGYTSARMTTQNKVEHAYGRIEARIKIPRGQGI
ncbi:glycoside hydrolase family 16 protein, partial [Nocardiopsis dassonvillei]